MYKQNPKVSIIMPVYNGERYIGNAIGSVIAQSYNNWELIIVNDGSVDGTEKKILKFNEERIIYLKQINKGVSAARNMGLKKMTGDYFCFLDADDSLPSSSLSSRLKVFKSDEDVEFVDGSVASLEGNEIIFSPTFKGNPRSDLILLTGRSFFGPTWMIKNKGKQYLFKEGLTHGEDLLFYISISSTGKYYYTENEVYRYRVSNESAMSNLKGLERGYAEIYKALKRDFKISKLLTDRFRSKAKSIMIKSYLANFQLLNATRLLLNKCK